MAILSDILWHDARFAEQHTRCKRRGCAARLIYMDSADSEVVINGNEFCTGEQGACGCAHAEALAIVRTLRAGKLLPHTLYVTLSPCTQCARLIVESGIVRDVLYLREYRDIRGLRILRSAGIQVTHVQ